MEYLIAGLGALSILAVGLGIPWALGLFRRPTVTPTEIEPNPYLLDAPPVVLPPPALIQRSRSRKTVVVNRPRLHERIAAREAAELTDENLAEHLVEWHRSFRL